MDRWLPPLDPLALRATVALVTAALLAGAPARATEAPDLPTLVARVAEALGGRERLAAIAGYEVISDAEGLGLQGTAHSAAAFPDRQRAALDLGPLSLLLVVDGGRGWMRDHNGHVVELDAFERAEATTTLFVDAYRPWLDPPDPDVLSLAGAAEIDGRPCHLLRIAPPGGNPTELAIDAERWLPVRERRVDEAGLGFEVTRLDDYRPVDGVQIPFFVRSFHDQLPDNATVYRVRSVSLSPPTTAGVFAPPVEQSDVTFPPGVSSLTLPLAYRAGHLFLPVHLIGDGAGLDGWFLVDTGTTLSMLDAAALAPLGLEATGAIQGLGVGGPLDVQLVEVPFVRVGGVLLEGQLLGVGSFADAMRDQLGTDVIGLLGYDFFSRMVVTLDYDGRCTLHHGNTWRVPAGGVTLPLALVDQQPTVEATLDGELGGRWRLDTGADSLAVHTPAARRWALAERHAPARELRASGIQGEARVRAIWARSFRLGPYEIARPEVLLAGDDGGVFTAESVVGNVGNAVLERFVVTVDFGGQRLHLRPGSRFGDDDRVRTVDADIGWAGERIVVRAVVPGGEAERAGLRAGQTVLRLGGRAAARWTPAELRALWAGERGDGVRLVVRDEDGRRTRVGLAIPAPPASPAPAAPAAPAAD